MSEKVVSYYCQICNAEVKVNAYNHWMQDEPEFFFLQVKKIGKVRYTKDYAFCSKEHMMQYLKQSKAE